MPLKPFESSPGPSTLAAAARILLLPRPGLADASAMPQIERATQGVQLNPAWLEAYADCIGLNAAAVDATGLPPLTLQLASAALHLSILADAAFPFKALGLVHLGQSVVQHGRLDALARFDLRALTTDARMEKRGISFGLVTEARAQGRLVWRAELRALSITRPRAAKEVAPNLGTEPESAIQRIARLQFDVPEHMGRRYARIAGDRNPIHQHAWLARPFGFQRAIVHGTWTLARALVSAGLPGADRFQLQARFQRPVELPSQIVVAQEREPGSERQFVRVLPVDGGKPHLVAEVMVNGHAA